MLSARGRLRAARLVRQSRPDDKVTGAVQNAGARTTVGVTMVSPELVRSWQRTEGFLRDARSHLSQMAEAEFRDELVQFEEYLEHNEFGIAFDILESLTRESQGEELRVFELLAL